MQTSTRESNEPLVFNYRKTHTVMVNEVERILKVKQGKVLKELIFSVSIIDYK